MPRTAAGLRFGALAAQDRAIGYDSSKLIHGTLTRQQNGATSEEKYVGPLPIVAINLAEQAGGVGGAQTGCCVLDTDRDLLVQVEVSASSRAVVRVMGCTYSKAANAFTYLGALQLSMPGTAAHTITDIRPAIYRHTTGTVAVAGGAITGTGTLFTTERIASGARIKFGTNDPNHANPWYDLTAITTDTAATIADVAAAWPAGTAYVIEEMRIYYSNTLATHGGLYVVKGLHPGIFDPSASPLTILLASATDNLRRVYKLNEATGLINYYAIALGPQTSMTDHRGYVYNHVSSADQRILVFNLRAALVVASGVSQSAFLLKSGVYNPGGSQAVALMIYANVGITHGAPLREPSLYAIIQATIKRFRVADLAEGVVPIVLDSMADVGPSAGNTFRNPSHAAPIAYSPVLDRFLTRSANYGRGTIFQFANGSQPIDSYWAYYNGRLYGTTSAAGNPIQPDVAGDIEASLQFPIVYCMRGASTTTAANAIYAVPLGADRNYGDGVHNGLPSQMVICPKIATPGATRLVRAVPLADAAIGTLDGYNLTTEPFRTYVRTAGIDDNSGGWTQVPDDGSMTGVAAGTHIQFAFEFRMISDTAVGARVFSVDIIYDADDPLPANFVFMDNDTDGAAGIVGVKQLAAVNGGVAFTTVTVRYYDAAGVLVATYAGTNAAPNGWEYWTGAAWAAGVGPDAANTRRRHTAAALVAGTEYDVKFSWTA